MRPTDGLGPQLCYGYWLVGGMGDGGSHTGSVYSMPAGLRFGVISSPAIFRFFFYLRACMRARFVSRSCRLV